jgi:hypothetical protein
MRWLQFIKQAATAITANKMPLTGLFENQLIAK